MTDDTERRHGIYGPDGPHAERAPVYGSGADIVFQDDSFFIVSDGRTPDLPVFDKAKAGGQHAEEINGFNAGPFGSDTEPISVHGRPDGQVWVEGDDVCLFEGTPEAARKLAGALMDAAGWVEENSSEQEPATEGEITEEGVERALAEERAYPIPGRWRSERHEPPPTGFYEMVIDADYGDGDPDD